MFQNDCNETEIFISILSIFYLEFVCVQAFICIKQYKKKSKRIHTRLLYWMSIDESVMWMCSL